ncbi:hypothetical protein D3C71_2148010 [compost metagenome]
MAVSFHPMMEARMTTATSFTRGEVMRKTMVTPTGMPPSRKPMNSGTDEQEQNGVTAPSTAANP